LNGPSFSSKVKASKEAVLKRKAKAIKRQGVQARWTVLAGEVLSITAQSHQCVLGELIHILYHRAHSRKESINKQQSARTEKKTR
jgi:hypothetical protein